MPTLQMKAKAISSCEKDGYLHRLCQESSKISKKKSSFLWKSHETVDVETIEFKNGAVSEGTRIDEAIHSEKDSKQDIFMAQERLSFSEDLTSPIVDSSQAPCPSPLERVSSIPVESKVTDCNSSVSDDIGREDYPVKKPVEINYNTRSINCPCHLSSHDLDLHFLDDVDGNTRRDGDGTMALDDIMKSSLVQQLEWTESNMLVDMTGNCVMLPFPLPEETVNTSFFQGHTLSDELLMNSESAIFNMVTHHSKICDQALANCRPADSVEMDSFDPILFIRNFLDLSDLEANSLPALLPEETIRGKHITLVLDLDETLVHSTLEPCDDADFTIQVSLNMEQHTFYVRQRPFLKTFLERVSEMFEIVLFTASQRFYAEQLLDHLDPDRKFFSRREYRETCVLSDGIFTKDLTVLGVDLAKVAIVDNSPQVFRWQVNNGIPIMSWFNDPLDCELIALLPFLETLVEAEDVRPIIAKRFGGKG